MPPSLVQVAQTPAFFDFPRRHLPDHFHYTGPWSEPEGGNDADFPWDRVDGRPLIYASFGTLQNRLQHAFRLVAEACAGLDAQLVLTLGHEGASLPENLPGNPIVVDYAPQVALLRRARLVITHGGLNTTLECLSEGLPLIALPIANDQPGVAARIARLGVGEFIPIKKLTASKLRDAARRVLASPTYRIQAEKCALEIQRIDGPARAAELVEVAFTTRQRVKWNLPE
jgi:MGT family glycosyltransferase